MLELIVDASEPGGQLRVGRVRSCWRARWSAACARRTPRPCSSSSTARSGCPASIAHAAASQATAVNRPRLRSCHVAAVRATPPGRAGSPRGRCRFPRRTCWPGWRLSPSHGPRHRPHLRDVQPYGAARGRAGRRIPRGADVPPGWPWSPAPGSRWPVPAPEPRPRRRTWPARRCLGAAGARLLRRADRALRPNRHRRAPRRSRAKPCHPAAQGTLSRLADVLGWVVGGAIGASITRSSRPGRFGEVEDDPW
jgi:hypothetical protein